MRAQPEHRALPGSEAAPATRRTPRRAANQSPSGSERARKPEPAAAPRPPAPANALRRPRCDHRFCRNAPRCLIEEAVAGLAIGLVLIDPRGRLVWLNRAAERVLGLTASAALGRPFGRLLRDPRLAAFWHEAGCAVGNCLGEVSVRWPQPAELKLNATQCLDERGAELGRALLFCDVTNERTVHIELAQEVAAKLAGWAGPGVSGPQPPPPAAGLTAQELRILRLVGRGLGNEDIARQLNVAASTIRSHLKNIYRKLQLRTRAEAVRFAVHNGLT
ncbi:MAG: LuxR C-terminal-related transcriptional regulator [Planctomycetota bacterium]